MKIQHDKTPKENFVTGRTYRVSKDGKALYDAEVVKFGGGCWATVRVEKAIDESTARYYHSGMEFDIKVAEYEIGEA